MCNEKVKEVLVKIIEAVIKILEIVKLWIDYCADEPPLYEPSRWNDDYSIRIGNNCYNYACNIITNTFAQPGDASGNPFDSWDGIQCQEVTNSALSDGLKIYENEECMSCAHQIALFIDPEWPEYHWYRKDRHGLWSHKPGDGKATNLDYANLPIVDPRFADRRSSGGALNYTQFCSFFCASKGYVTIV